MFRWYEGSFRWNLMKNQNDIKLAVILIFITCALMLGMKMYFHHLDEKDKVRDCSEFAERAITHVPARCIEYFERNNHTIPPRFPRGSFK